MKEQHLEHSEATKKLVDLLDDVKVCMFATVQKDYSLYSRPMQTIQVDEEGALWFFTNEYSGKVEDVSYDDTVYLMFSDPGKNTYIHVKGSASVVTNKEKIKELWSPVVKAWFPKGVDDPALSLLKVETHEASYWDGPSSKFVVFYNMVKAIAKGETPDEGEFGKLNLD